MPEFSEGQPQGADIPIFHPDELNRMLENKEFSDKVAAVTMTSIDAARRLLSDPSRNFNVYDSRLINLNTVDDVYENLWGHVLSEKDSTSKTISSNAEAFGWTQAGIGIVYERASSPEAAKELTSFFEDWETFPQRAIRDFSDKEIDEKFTSYQGVAAYVKEIWPDEPEENQKFEKALQDAFPDVKVLISCLKDLRNRRGVQLIIGDREKFVEFVKSQRHEPVDDKAVELYADIPRELIIGIVPRGQHEQQELLAA